MVPSMLGTTHFKHCSLIPPLVSNNSLALLRCGYMRAGTLVHIARYLGKTSNNNRRCQLCTRLYIFPCLFPSGFTSDFWFYDHYYIIVSYILLYHLCSILPVSCSYFIKPCIFFTWYHLLSLSCSYMLVLMARFSMHIYNSSLSLHVCLPLHAIWH